MKLLVIDGNSIVNRAFYGIRALSNKKGVFTNAITGFMNIFLKLENNFKPDCVAVAFDLKAPTFRHKLYSEYKGTRKGMPDELAVQLPYVKEILGAMGIAVVEREGWEADDILGTLSHAAELSGGTAVIATGDRDSFQLITDKVSVNLAGNKEDVLYTPSEIMEKYGVQPKQMIEIKALMGDSSDNIPGVKGIGEKTAVSLIQENSTVSNIYEKLDELTISDSLRRKLSEGKDSCFMSRELGTISLEAPVDTDLTHYIPKERNEVRLAEILTELEMFTVLKKLNVAQDSLKKAAETASKKAVQEAADSCGDNAEAAPDRNVPDVMAEDGAIKVYSAGEEIFVPDVKEFLESPSEKRSFDLKGLYGLAMGKGIRLNNFSFDCTLAAYLLNASSSDYSFERLCTEYGASGEGMAETLYGLTSKLMNKIRSEKLNTVLTDIEMPLAEVLTSMETEGVKIDLAGIDKFGEELEKKIAYTEELIYEQAGEKFNIGSPKQLGIILFEKLRLPYGKKTKAGGYSTNADVLDTLWDIHPIIPLISDYRAFTKLQSTYVKGLKDAVSPDGRIHTTFKQTETRTGRISSAEPNIQNIPVRTELGKNMRRFFTAREGCVLVDADYSQIELRVLAHLAGDLNMQKAFLSGEDIHTITASQVFNQPVEWVTPELRSRAKAVNFGIVYGIGAFSLSKDIKVSVAEAKQYIDAYLAKYSGVDAFMKNTVKNAEQNLYVETMFGRRRYIPDINASNKIVQAAAKRIAMNTPIQGTAADIIKLAMIKVYQRLKKEKLPARLILQVHDELIVEAEEQAAEETARLLKEEMEGCVKLAVPLTADVKIGKTWFDTH
ncbi:MAG: DNA polymerase I [[Eubacterium] siraeum]|nr:DNA polymerase I [[Eubacterium] siraeum]